MKIPTIFGVVALALAVILVASAGCSFDRFVEVTEGTYLPVDTGTAFHDGSGIDLIESITVDRHNGTLKIRLKDGGVIDSTFVSRPESEWPSGCPANLGSTKMEVLNLGVDKLGIGRIVLENPVLVRDCPRNPARVVLREDGQIGGAGTACAGNDICIHFRPDI